MLTLTIEPLDLSKREREQLRPLLEVISNAGRNEAIDWEQARKKGDEVKSAHRAYWDGKLESLGAEVCRVFGFERFVV